MKCKILGAIFFRTIKGNYSISCAPLKHLRYNYGKPLKHTGIMLLSAPDILTLDLNLGYLPEPLS